MPAWVQLGKQERHSSELEGKGMDTMKNESQLLRAARNIDEAALITIYDHFAPKVYAHALKQCHDPDRADDIVGKVFAQFLEELSAGKGPSNGLQTYFYQSATDYIQGRKTGQD